MFGMFEVKKKVPETPAEQKLEDIKNLLFPPMELHERYDEQSGKTVKYHIDYSADSNLDSVLSDLQEGFNDANSQKTVENVIKTLNEVRRVLEAYWSIDKDAEYIIVDNKKEENDPFLEE